jgi:streptogramin lyase
MKSTTITRTSRAAMVALATVLLSSALSAQLAVASPTHARYAQLRGQYEAPIVVKGEVRNVVQTAAQLFDMPMSPRYAGTVRTIITTEPQTFSMTGLSFDPVSKTFYASFGNVIDKITLAGQASPFASDFCTGVTAFDTASNLLYEFDPCRFAMNVIDQSGTVTFLAGGTQGTGDGTGSGAQFEGVTGITIDPTTDTLYVSDGNAVRQVTTNGVVTTLAQIGNASGISFDTADGNLYAISGRWGDIDKVTLSGIVLWFSARGIGCCYQEDGPPGIALFANPAGIVYSAHDNAFFIADASNNQIREVTASGKVKTLAGSGVAKVKDGVGNRAAFVLPEFLALDPMRGALYVASYANIRVTTTTGPTAPPPTHGIALENPPSVPNASAGLAVASNGTTWFTEATANKIGKLSPGGKLNELPLPGGFGSPGQMILGGDGDMWFIDSNPPAFPNSPPLNNYLARVTAAGRITEFAVSTRAITLGPDGNVWFAGTGVGYVTPLGAITQYLAGSTPQGVAKGFDGNIWTFANPIFDQSEIDKISTGGILLKQYIFQQSQTFITSLVAGSDRRMWFVTDQGQQIGAMTLDGNATFYNLPLTQGCFSACTGPGNLTLGPDGAIWFTQGTFSGFPGAIGRITPAGVYSSFQVPAPRSGPSAISFMPDGTLWFADPGANKLGHKY